MTAKYDRIHLVNILSVVYHSAFGDSTGGEFVHAMPYRAGAYNERTPLMVGIRNDGIDL